MTQARLGLAVVGFIFALAAVLRDDRRLGWIAIGFLAVAFVLRVIHQRQQQR